MRLNAYQESIKSHYLAIANQSLEVWLLARRLTTGAPNRWK